MGQVSFLHPGVTVSSKAFDRWRSLYLGAREMLVEANRRSEMHGLTREARNEAKRQQAQANEQINLLERGDSSTGADFYTYRYLATEGFLPGYNFPRLPLYAYIPSVFGSKSGAAYLQRARFIAIAEFGPGSLIYHEGRAYRVARARLPAGARDAEGRLMTSRVIVCGECGAGHRDERERCHACNAGLADASEEIGHVLRVDSVETQPAERITANDEDRQRQGFEIQTIFAWPQRHGAIDVSRAGALDEEGLILSLDYASGAEISRLNKGLRRRREKSLTGFHIDPATGRWGKVDSDDDDAPDIPKSVRVVPIVQDNKNAALLRLKGETLDEAGMATLQYALTRGLEVVFQLEAGETLTEPTPSRESRKAILAYEATEGGAGVLGRLASEPAALARVAREALGLMHYRDIEAAINAADPALLEEEPDAECVKGCYRCLLSYFNQPDHEIIDRRHDGALRVLLRLARSTMQQSEQSAEAAYPAGHAAWLAAIIAWGLPRPDPAALEIDGASFPLAWRSHLVAASFIPTGPEVRAALNGRGFELVILPAEPDQPPGELVRLLGQLA